MASTVTELLRRRFGGKSLPYDAEIEYLSSNNVAYIDTGIIPKDSPRIILNLKYLGSADRDVFGFLNNTIPAFIGDFDVYTNNMQSARFYRYYSTGSVGPDAVSSVPYNEWAEWDMSNIVKCNGTTLYSKTKSSFISNTQTIYLLRGRNVAFKNQLVGKVKIYDGDVLMRDFIPVRVGTTGYMYDKVSGQLFGNAGTGDFILGNDINT